MKGYTYTVADRFIKYVQVDTQSDPQSNTHPTTEKQKDLSRVLVEELKAIGASDIEMDEWGYVFATIPATSSKQLPTLCFCAHVDTAPDCSGTHVKPIVHNKYDGSDIVLPDDNAQVISPSKYPYLLEKKGEDIITASGTTLLGSDDKSGVAIIMDMANYLLTHPEIKHGKIRLLFTPDEEVGKGTAKLDMKRLNADFGYTLDGGELGTLEDETFSADGAKIIVEGVIAHPGYAKDTLVNAIKIVGEILAELPKNEFSPETTEKRQGFVHPTRVEGIAEKAAIEFIVRDFETANLAKHEARLKEVAETVMKRHPKASMKFEAFEQYRNMKEVLDKHPEVVSFATKAIEACGLSVTNKPIRGGTDGSRLSFMGLPTANMFTGMQAIHSKHEYVSIQDMQKAVDVLVKLVQVWEEEG